MARKHRVHFPGAIYHVICRGNNRESVFSLDIDKQSYLALVKEYKEKHQFKLYAWAILSNHAHMLIEVGQTPLSKVMQSIQQTYTGRYNHHNKRTGHVFEQRYKAFLCKDDERLLELIHYIHHNPVRAGLPGGANNPYCSHRDYIWGSAHGFTDIEFPLSLFADDKNLSVKRYQEFMQREESYSGRLTSFSRDERENMAGMLDSQQDLVLVTLPQLLNLCAELSGLDTCDLIGGSRQKNVVRARLALVQFCVRHTLINQKELAEALSVSNTAVSKATRSSTVDVCEMVAEMLAKVK